LAERPYVDCLNILIVTSMRLCVDDVIENVNTDGLCAPSPNPREHEFNRVGELVNQKLIPDRERVGKDGPEEARDAINETLQSIGFVVRQARTHDKDTIR
jgi:hypothetical protein